MFYKFPEDFSWGSAVWAQGVEGAAREDGKAMTVFEKYYENAPERFYKRQSPEYTLDWYHKYAEYADILEHLHHKSFRTSISWARLMPDGKTVNAKAVAYYHDMLQDLKARGIKVWVVLYWFDMPVLFEEQGGFTNREVIQDFVRYAKICFQLFDELVDLWYIYNEPVPDADFKYLFEACYPNRVDFKAHTQAIYHMILAHALVVEEYHNGPYHKKIGSVLNDAPVYPRSNHPHDVEAARRCDLLNFRCFMDPLLKGEFPKGYFELLKKADAVPESKEEDFTIIRNNTMDVLGINYYYPERVKAKVHLPDFDGVVTRESFYDEYEMPGRNMNKSRGWEIYPKALYDTLMIIKEEYGNIECYITENGIGIEDEEQFRNKAGIIDDKYRIAFMKEHLIWGHKAIKAGVNLRGYHVWSLIDLWSPTNQFKNLYGLVELQRKDLRTREKASAEWYRTLIDQHGFESEEEGI